ncbi:hypothetical protein LG290_02870 [Halomonas sediminis]
MSRQTKLTYLPVILLLLQREELRLEESIPPLLRYELDLDQLRGLRDRW